MASSDYDQKILGKIAKATATENPIVSRGLYQILGLSVPLSKKVYKARRLRKLDTSRDTKSLQLYHQIIWTSREGLSILNSDILPYMMMEEYGPESLILTLKLRASFFHIICLFYNQPPVSQIQVPTNRAPLALPEMPIVPERDLPPELSGSYQRSTGLSPPPARGQTLREPITSIVSEGSILTNPYPMDAPPGLAPIPNTAHPMSYLIPHRNYLPLTDSYFNEACARAASALPGSHPLRLSVTLEYVAFLWDCQHDHERSREFASRAIRDTYTAEEGMEDEEFIDASRIVKTLHQMIKRKSWEGTPRTGHNTSTDTHLLNSNGAPVDPTTATATITTNNRPTQRTPEMTQQGGPVLGSPFVSGDQHPPGSRRSKNRGNGGGNSNGGGPLTPRATSRAKGGYAGSGGSASSSGGRSSGRSMLQKSGSSNETTPRFIQGTKRDSGDTGASSTPRATQSQRRKSPKRQEEKSAGRGRRSSKP